MKYELVNATKEDIEYVKKAKLYSIFNYADNLPKEEVLKINKYVENNIPIEIFNYKIVKSDNEKIGCLLVTKKDDDTFLDEIYLEEEYRNKGIGTSIIKDTLKTNSTVYLWVYKNNINAISLYKKLNFEILNETEDRYYMKHVNSKIKLGELN